MRRIVQCAMVAMASALLAQAAGAQALGPQRQFLAIEPYYERTQLDVGSALAKDGLNGFGARLWINLDQFHFILNSSLAIYGSHAPSQSGRAASLSTFGAEYDQFLVRRPIGGLIDPFLSLGGGATWIRGERQVVFGKPIGSAHAYGTLVPGAGIRIPMPNRFELRTDVKDAILFNTPSGTANARRTTNNLVVQAGLGVTF